MIVKINWSTDHGVHNFQEHPDIYEIRGEIRCSLENDEETDEEDGLRKAGTCRGFLYNLMSCHNRGDSIIDQAGSISSEALEYIAPFLTSKRELAKPNVAGLVGMSAGRSPDRVLSIEGIYLEPFARGMGLGCSTVLSIAGVFGGGCDILALKAEPYQKTRKRDENVKLDLPEYKPDASSKLLKHWGSMGFQRVGKSQYMVCSLDDIGPPKTIGIQSTI